LLELNCVIHGCIWIPSLSSKCLFSKPVHYYLEKNACGLSLTLCKYVTTTFRVTMCCRFIAYSVLETRVCDR
jgi:hypothetical protein